MKRIILIVCFLLVSLNGYAMEKIIYPILSLERGFIKARDDEKRVDTLQIEIDSEFRRQNTKLVLYPIIQYDVKEKDEDIRLRKGYLASLINDWYIGIGRQPIIWGVGRGRNPTNYFKEIEVFEKQKDKKVMEGGIDSIVVSYTSYNKTYEGVFSDKKSLGLRFKAFLKGVDFSTSLYYDYSDDSFYKAGFDLERDFLNWFNVYNEFAYRNKSEYQYLCGLSRQLSVNYKSDLVIEYLYDKKREADYLLSQFTISPQEEVSLFSILLYDINSKMYLFMPKVNFYIKKVEISLISKIPLNKREECPDIIVGRISYYF